MSKREMVTPSRIAEIAKDSLPRTISLDHTLEFGINCYEKGMFEVLRMVAVQSLGTGRPISMTKFTKRLNRSVHDKYEALNNCLRDYEKKLLENFTDSAQELSAAEMEEYFVIGFIRGYQYLKNQIVHEFDQFENGVVK